MTWTRRNFHLSLPTLAVCIFLIAASGLRGDEPKAKVYVILWFDTEDYILPASDDAALRVADFLTAEKVRGTFKVVGEKARTLERRSRKDVIEALRKHEIGYHSNWHSTQPSPAMYLNNLGWDEGVAEFDRREKPGFDDVKRIFGVAPSCYGQPGSSWGPQSFGAMRQWGMPVYLDAGSHVDLDQKPCYYCGLFNLYRLAHTIRANIHQPKEYKAAEERFLEARQKLLAEGGGVVSIVYHPCEFVHNQFWDGANFTNGANPPREKWVLPKTKTPEESKAAYEVFENYVRFMKRFPDVRFVTATEAVKIYRDKAKELAFTPAELKAIASAVTADVSFQRRDGYALAASEIFELLNHYVARRDAKERGANIKLGATPLGPTGRIPGFVDATTTDLSQFQRTVADVEDYLEKHKRIPSAVWLGSVAVPPEAYLNALARVTLELIDGKSPPENIPVKPAKLAAARYVSEDGPHLWGWVIFPKGFRASAMMDLAKQQAWTLKPALIDQAGE
jgi:hypothetical protein